MGPIFGILKRKKKMEKKEVPVVKKEDDGTVETKYRRSVEHR